MATLGLTATTLPYATAHNIGESQGHDVETIIPGASPDSVVVIVHYDSIGPQGQETSNPGADDDMTGISTLMEAARVLSAPCVTRAKTLRLVASDYEEQNSPQIEGANYYANYIKQLAQSQNFQLVDAMDYEQMGWNQGSSSFDLVDCSGDSNNFDSSALGNTFTQLSMMVSSPLTVNQTCIPGGATTDGYAMWEIGVSTVIPSEHDPESNPHFDSAGGDLYSLIDTTYYAEIARVTIAFTAQLIGVGQ
jgi:hypothetical protein